MILPDRLTNTYNTLVEYYNNALSATTGVRRKEVTLNVAIDQLGYDDAGLICARLRSNGDPTSTALAVHIEKRRFKL